MSEVLRVVRWCRNPKPSLKLFGESGTCLESQGLLLHIRCSLNWKAQPFKSKGGWINGDTHPDSFLMIWGTGNHLLLMTFWGGFIFACAKTCLVFAVWQMWIVVPLLDLRTYWFWAATKKCTISQNEAVGNVRNSISIVIRYYGSTILRCSHALRVGFQPPVATRWKTNSGISKHPKSV